MSDEKDSRCRTLYRTRDLTVEFIQKRKDHQRVDARSTKVQWAYDCVVNPDLSNPVFKSFVRTSIVTGNTCGVCKWRRVQLCGNCSICTKAFCVQCIATKRFFLLSRKSIH